MFVRKISIFAIVFLILTYSCLVRINIDVQASPSTIVVPDEYPTIKEAIDAASEDDTVYVRTGSYSEMNGLILNKRIRLIGENSSSTLISTWGGDAVIDVFADRCTVENLGVIGYIQYGIHLRSKNNNITDNRISGCKTGIAIESNSSYNVLRNNHISNNNVNFGITGFSLEDYAQDIDTSNLVEEKPVYYLVNRNDLTIDPLFAPDVGFLALVNCTNMKVEDLNLNTNNTEGVLVAYTKASTIARSIIANSYFGMWIFESSNNIIKSNKIKENYVSIVLSGSSYNTIEGNEITDNSFSLITEPIFTVGKSSNNIIQENNITKNKYGLYLFESPQNILKDNRIFDNEMNFGVWGLSSEDFIQNIDTSNSVDGKPVYYWIDRENQMVPADAGYVALVHSRNITVTNLKLKNNLHCILLAYTNNSLIADNEIGCNMFSEPWSMYIREPYESRGVFLCHATNNTILKNKLESGDRGISILHSSDNIIEHNMGLSVSLENCTSNIIKENTAVEVTLDGSSLNIVTKNNLVHVRLDVSDSNIVGRNTINQGMAGKGILLSHSFNNVIERNNITLCPLQHWISGAIYIEQGSGHNVIAWNNLNNNSEGITIVGSCYNTIRYNVISNNSWGISLFSDPYYAPTHNNTFIDNEISNNNVGVYLSYVETSEGLPPTDNVFYHNNFIRNVGQFDLGYAGKNVWNDVYPSGGNYWSDYDKRYPNATEINSSGVWDTPYVIEGNNVDRFPLVKPWRLQYDLPVSYEAQGNAGWCWAASTAMVLRYYGKNIHVWDVGKTRPLTWSLTHIESYIHETYPGEFETKIGRYSSVSEQTREDIEGNLSECYPVLLNVDTSIGRHTIVVTDYNSSGFFINDPSGAFFVKGLGRIGSFPYIHEFASWAELQPLISIDLVDRDTFLVVKGTPSPVDATLFLINDEAGIRTVHDLDSGKGVCIDYGGWYWSWGLYWRPIGWHPVAWDLKDNLSYLYEIFNHRSQEARFDFHLEIIGKDSVIYYKKDISDISVPGYDSLYAVELNIPLKDYLIQGKQYVVSAEIKHHGSSEIIDSITLPPIYYGVKSVMFASECPVRLLITDPEGLSVGYNATSDQTISQIPDAIYYYGNGSMPEAVSITNQKTGNYSVKVVGIENGAYNLTCTSIDQEGAFLFPIVPFSNVSIQQGESQNYVIPEFPHILILSLLMVITLFAVALRKRKQAKISNFLVQHSTSVFMEEGPISSFDFSPTGYKTNQSGITKSNDMPHTCCVKQQQMIQNE